MKKLLLIIINSLIWFIGLVVAKVTYSRDVRSYRLALIRIDAIGDFVLFSPALRYIREKYKNFRITLVLQDYVTELAENCPYIDEVISFNRKKYKRNLFYKLNFLLKLHLKRFEICLYPVYSRELAGDEMVLWTSASKRAGWDTEIPNMTTQEKNRGDKIYTMLFKSSFTQQTHEIERNQEFLRHLGVQFDSFKPELWIPEKTKIKIQNLLLKEGLDKKSVIAIVLGASARYRQWGSDKYKMLMKCIKQINKDAFFIIVGGPNDRDILDFGGEDVMVKSLLNLCGRISLKELPALFEECSMVIGNETGPLHIAIAVGAPSVCILGGGHFGRFMPYGNQKINRFVYKEMECFNCNWRCIYHVPRCIMEITVEDVFKEVKELLFVACDSRD